MECIQEQQAHPELEILHPPQKRRAHKVKEIDMYEKESAEFRRYLASEKVIRELERTRVRSLAAAQRMSFIR